MDETLYFTSVIVQSGNPSPEHIALCPSVLEVVDVALDELQILHSELCNLETDCKSLTKCLYNEKSRKFCRRVGMVFVDK